MILSRRVFDRSGANAASLAALPEGSGNMKVLT